MRFLLFEPLKRGWPSTSSKIARCSTRKTEPRGDRTPSLPLQTANKWIRLDNKPVQLLRCNRSMLLHSIGAYIVLVSTIEMRYQNMNHFIHSIREGEKNKAIKIAWRASCPLYIGISSGRYVYGIVVRTNKKHAWVRTHIVLYTILGRWEWERTEILTKWTMRK